MASPPMSKRQKLDISDLIAYIDLLPNEMLELIFKMATGNMTTQKRYEFLVDVIPNVSSRFRSLSSAKPLWSGFAALEMLPNEVAEIPIKMLLNNLKVYRRHDYLVDVIAKVSTRLKNLATSKSLWKGTVYVKGNREKMKQVINEFLNEDVTNLVISIILVNERFMSAEDILDIFSKCPKLTVLKMHSHSILAWPNLHAPCTTLKKLWLGIFTPDMFEGVDLHKSFPNLEELFTTCHNTGDDPMPLPDMSKCRNLEEVWLIYGKFMITGLPRGLKRLNCSSHPLVPTIVGIERSSLEGQLEKCEIDSRIKFKTS